MSTRLLRPKITAEIDGATFKLRDSTIALDAGSVPYAKATVELPFLDDATLATLDPRAGDVRVPITAADVAGTPRVFDLGLRERAVNHRDKTVKLWLASDEALVQDYAVLADDTTCRALEPSLRDVVNYALGAAIPGASLEAGDDADVTRYWPVTNLIPNTSFTANTSNWGTGMGASGLVRATFGARAAGQWTAAAGVSNVIPATSLTAYAVTAGKTYVFAFDIRSSVARNAQAAIQWRTGGGTITHATVYGAAIVTTNTGFRRAYIIATAPEGADYCQPFVTTSGNASGNLHYVTDAMFYEGDELVAFFNGATVATAAYSFAWADAAQANNTSSIRTPLLTGPAQEALDWPAGMTAWDFLAPLCASVGMVLWADEQRRWFLQTPESRTLPSLISVTPANAREGVDTLSRDDKETFVTGIVCRFRWKDNAGISQERIDSAGTPGKVLVQEFDRPFPGPGLAAAMLARRAGSGRTQDITAFTRWATTPGMTASINLPGAPETLGRVAGVTFEKDGFMVLKHAGLIDIIPGSWLATDSAEAWTDPPASTWLAWT